MQSDSYALKIGLSVTDRSCKALVSHASQLRCCISIAYNWNYNYNWKLRWWQRSYILVQSVLLGPCIYWCSQYSSVRVYISASPIFHFSILPNHNISLILASLPVDMFWERANNPPLLNYPILRPDISCCSKIYH